MSKETRYKTGEKAPLPGTYKIDGLVNGYVCEDNAMVEMALGDTFPPAPSEQEAAYWVKAS
ncbi:MULTISPECIES: YjzC family protein [Salimicrobium]|uniref:General stress protein n=4 Tax=Salimicrobium TaxID=351195 RepID=K2G941_9BACI|nr:MULTISPECIES: YjzC family protein [Salimicrobium]AKG04925.1 general stress protein [Salimicrobium jeotgali]EKE31598.1 general stress protein [Salimicrobium jeotgali]MBM7696419.1 hypothetical protein [Salimicrobium jeotgali]PBB06169.1 YjzC family protein [Salimicrobium humidisoli]SDX43648.1 YjzC-like protein [Salimicrobium album]